MARIALLLGWFLAGCLPGAHAAERESTLQPFALGDIFVAATVMDDPDDDHRGTGRILQFDADLRPKGVLWIPQTTHKIGGLTFAPDGVLWGFAPQSWQVIEVNPAGELLPLRSFGTHTFNNVAFAPDGSLYLAEHLQGDKLKISFNTTVFAYMPGTRRIGNGHIYRFSSDGRMLAQFDNETHGGVAGIHGASNTVLEDNGRRMIYFSETGNRLMQYDLSERRQLPDLAVYDGTNGQPQTMLLFLSQMPDRRLLLATGSSLLLVDPDSGALQQEIALGTSGWAAVAPAIGGEHVLIGNFFTGEFVRLRLNDGKIVARSSINEQRSLSGIAQYPGK